MPIKALTQSILSFEATWFDLNEATGILCTRNKIFSLNHSMAVQLGVKHMSRYDVTSMTSPDLHLK
jgi:hypothetical protein